MTEKVFHANENTKLPDAQEYCDALDRQEPWAVCMAFNDLRRHYKESFHDELLVIERLLVVERRGFRPDPLLRTRIGTGT